MLLTTLCAAAAIAPLKASVGTKRFVLLSSGGVHAVMQNTTIAVTLKIRGGCDVDSKGKRAGKGALIQWEKSGTLGVSQDQTLFVLKETERGLPTEARDGQGGIMYTLNSVEVHSVAYEEKDGVLVLNDQGGCNVRQL